MAVGNTGSPFSAEEVWEKFIQINFFLNDLLFIYIFMCRSNRNLEAYSLYFRTEYLDFGIYNFIFYTSLCSIWRVKGND